MAKWILALLFILSLIGLDLILCAPTSSTNTNSVIDANSTKNNLISVTNESATELSSSSLDANLTTVINNNTSLLDGNSSIAVDVSSSFPGNKTSETNLTLFMNEDQNVTGTNNEPEAETTPPRPQDIFVITTPTPVSNTTIPTLVPTTTTATTTTTPTPTEPAILPCSARFRAHPTNPRMFEIARSKFTFEGHFQYCAANLVWNEEKCQCDWAVRTKKLDPKCGEYRAHPDMSKPWLYQRIVQYEWRTYSCSIFIKGLWSSERCKCIYGHRLKDKGPIIIPKTDPSPKEVSKCVVVSNLTMDERLDKDYSGGHVTMGRNARVRIGKTAGGIGNVALVRRSPVQIDAFYANDLTDTMRFALNFKVHRFSVKSKRFMTLITNGCWQRRRKYKIPPSIELRIRPFDEMLSLNFATGGRRVKNNVKANRDKDGWYRIILYLQDDIINLLVNGKSVFTSNGMKGPLLQRECKLMLAGSPYNSRDHFDGYIDEFLSVKQCRCDCRKGPSYNLLN